MIHYPLEQKVLNRKIQSFVKNLRDRNYVFLFDTSNLIERSKEFVQTLFVNNIVELSLLQINGNDAPEMIKLSQFFSNQRVSVKTILDRNIRVKRLEPVRTGETIKSKIRVSRYAAER